MGKALQQWESRIGRRLKLRDLHILSSVVQWGSMAKASTYLAMSQPAVSEAIGNLEDALRVRLLDRNSRGIEPTIYAQALLKRGHVVFDELRQGIRDIEFLADPTVGEVRIVSQELFAAGLLPAAIDRLSRRYPQIVVRVVQANTGTLEFQELRERKVDLALVRIPEAFMAGDLDIEILFDDLEVVVVGARSRWARRRKVVLAELVDEPWVLPPNQVVSALLTEAFNAHGLEVPQKRVNAGSILLLDAVANRAATARAFASPKVLAGSGAFSGALANGHVGAEAPRRGPVIPALPAIDAAPAKPAPPGEAAAIPTCAVPAIKIEAVPTAFDDVDRSLFHRIDRGDGVSDGAARHRHGLGSARHQTECGGGCQCPKRVMHRGSSLWFPPPLNAATLALFRRRGIAGLRTTIAR